MNVAGKMPKQIRRNVSDGQVEGSNKKQRHNTSNSRYTCSRRRTTAATLSLIIARCSFITAEESLAPSISISCSVVDEEEESLSFCRRHSVRWDIIFGFSFQLAKRELIANVLSGLPRRAASQIVWLGLKGRQYGHWECHHV